MGFLARGLSYILTCISTNEVVYGQKWEYRFLPHEWPCFYLEQLEA